MFQANALLKDNDSVEAEDMDKYYFLFLAFKKRVQAKETEENSTAAKHTAANDPTAAPW